MLNNLRKKVYFYRLVCKVLFVKKVGGKNRYMIRVVFVVIRKFFV